MDPHENYEFDDFPTDCTLKTCTDIISAKQKVLIKDVRRKFFNKICESVEDCSRSVELVFPENLWGDYRIKVTSELMERFGSIDISSERSKFSRNEFDIEFPSTSDPKTIPPDIKKIKIIFTKK